METWRYRYVACNPDALGREQTERLLNESGNVGWELVSVVSEGANWKGFYFKRRVEHAPEQESER